MCLGVFQGGGRWVACSSLLAPKWLVWVFWSICWVRVGVWGVTVRKESSMSSEIRIVRIDTRHGYFESSLSLLNSSFVSDERREEEELRVLVDGGSIFSFNVVECGGERVGLITTWNFGKFIYVEHFAVEASMRNRGVGCRVLGMLREMSGLPVLVEVEPEGSSVEAGRRIRFYQRAGFEAWTTPYIQPPYGRGKSAVPMLLMANGIEETLENSQIVKALLYKHVYKVKSVDFPHVF